MRPPRSIYDKGFKYTSAASTDVAATFARIRKQQQQQQIVPKNKGPRKVIMLREIKRET